MCWNTGPHKQGLVLIVKHSPLCLVSLCSLMGSTRTPVTLCSWGTPNANRTAPCPMPTVHPEQMSCHKPCHKLASAKDIPESFPKKEVDARWSQWTQNYQRILVTVFQRLVHLQVLFQIYWQPFYSRKPGRGKSVLASLPTAWGKPSPFTYKPSWLHLIAQSLTESPYQPMPLTGTHSAPSEI